MAVETHKDELIWIPKEDEEERARVDIYKYIFGFVEMAVVKCAIELGIADAIESHGSPMSLLELSSALGCAAPALLRIMRFLTNRKLFKEIRINENVQDSEQPSLYAQTALSRLILRSGEKSMATFVLMESSPPMLAPWHGLSARVKTEVDDSSAPSPFEVANGKDVWSYAAANPGHSQLINEAMACNARVTVAAILDGCLDVFDGIGTIVDVGGGNGTALRMLVRACPWIRGINFDLPHVVSVALKSEGVEHVGGDMFKFVPKADAAFLMSVLHDWEDDECIQILKKCREAIPGDKGKVIMVECVIEENNNNVEEKHEELELKDVGLFLDMVMIAHTNKGKERTLEEWAYVLAQADPARGGQDNAAIADKDKLPQATTQVDVTGDGETAEVGTLHNIEKKKHRGDQPVDEVEFYELDPESYKVLIMDEIQEGDHHDELTWRLNEKEEEERARIDIYKYVFGFVEMAVVKCAIELGIADTIESHGRPISLLDLSSALSCNPHNLHRIMRFLVNRRIFKEIKNDTVNDKGCLYVQTSLSRLLIKSGERSMASFVLMESSNPMLAPWHGLSARVKAEATDALTPFEAANGVDVWSYAAANPDHSQLINEAMACNARVTVAAILNGCLDVFDGVGSIVDVGGGNGTTLQLLVKGCPWINQGINFDLPHVVSVALKSDGVVHVGGDMFDSCKEAIPEKGKVIIVESVIENNKLEENVMKKELELKDVGLFLDMTMMAHTNKGKERSLDEWVYVLHQA
ncbi:hypothetical protein F8388_007139, partial [Cannabis sativa]